jgi:hypothetical protein
MRALYVVGAVAALMFSTVFTASADDCVDPVSPGDPPSGVSATREEMLAAQAAIKTFHTAVEEFAACIDKIRGNRFKVDAAMQRLEDIAARFNTELRAFRQKHGG